MKKLEVKRHLKTGEAAKKFKVSKRTIQAWLELVPFEVKKDGNGWLRLDDRAMEALDLIAQLRRDDKLSRGEIRQCLIEAFDASPVVADGPGNPAVAGFPEGGDPLLQLVTIFERYSELASKYSDALEEINELKEKVRRFEEERDRSFKQPFMRINAPTMRQTR